MAWLALDEVDEKNGCVRYVRGSNHLTMRSHSQTNTLGFSQGITDDGTDNDLANEVALAARPGDLLVHQAITIHRANGNQSESRNRRALDFIYHFASGKSRYQSSYRLSTEIVRGNGRGRKNLKQLDLTKYNQHEIQYQIQNRGSIFRNVALNTL